MFAIMNLRLKKIIFDKLYDDLSNVEIIPYNNSIWFIDREKEYWYFEYRKTGKLYWRWEFFRYFFQLFSLDMKEYEQIMSEWVEEVLNCKVDTTKHEHLRIGFPVEEVLN